MIIQKIKDLTRGITKNRSGKWPAVRKTFLIEHPTCAVCGGVKKNEAHHRLPFHTHPQLELDPLNLINLCEGNKNINCHLVVGHDFNFKGYNPDVEADASRILQEKEDNKKRIN